MLVIDATVAFDAAFDSAVFDRLEDPIGPPLLWSETTAALRQAAFRDALDEMEARAALDRFLGAPIERRMPRRLYETAWAIAREFGWAKTYDAEYVALAQIMDCPLLTKDARLMRRVGRLIRVVRPTELAK